MAKELSRRDFLKGIAAGAMGVAAAGVLGSVPVVAAAEEAKYTPGTYSAVAKGIASDVKVTMEFSETEILSVVIDSTGETPDIGGKAGPLLEKAILDAQGPDIDAVSGATVRCRLHGYHHQLPQRTAGRSRMPLQQPGRDPQNP